MIGCLRGAAISARWCLLQDEPGLSPESNIGIMEKKMETTTMAYIRGYIRDFYMMAMFPKISSCRMQYA